MQLLRSSLRFLDAVSTGVVAAVASFFAAALLTSSVVMLTLTGALALVLTTGWLSRRAARRSVKHAAWQRWLPWGVTGATLLLASTLAALTVFRPMDVTYQSKEPTPQTRYWELPTGSRLAYTLTPAQGTPRPMPVVQLHGGPGAPGRFEVTPEDLTLARAGFDVYRYDQVGSGLSERLEDASQYTVARHVTDLEAVRQELGAERLILVGGSWGATLAAHYMAAYPERVEKAVMSGPGAIWSPAFADTGGTSDGPERGLIWRMTTPRFAAAFLLLQLNPKAAQNLAPDHEMSGFFQRIVGRIISSDAAGCGPDAQAAPMSSEPRIPRGFGFYANMVTSADMGRVPDPRPTLRANRTPVLVLRGECERLRWDVVREYRDVFPNATLLPVEGASHSIPSTHPELHAEVIRAFLLEEPLPLVPYLDDEPPT